MPLSIHPSLALAAISVAILAAAFDGATGTIPNRITLPVLVGAPLVHVICVGPGGLGVSLLGAVACGAVPLLLFVRGGMGGGDVKLFAALGALVGAEDGLGIELASLFIALWFALFLLAWRGELLQTLQRCLRVLLPRAQAEHGGSSKPSTDSAATIRLGIPIAFATVLVLWLPKVVPWLSL